MQKNDFKNYKQKQLYETLQHSGKLSSKYRATIRQRRVKCWQHFVKRKKRKRYLRAVERSVLCTSRRKFSSENLIAKIGFDATEFESCKDCPLSGYSIRPDYPCCFVAGIILIYFAFGEFSFRPDVVVFIFDCHNFAFLQIPGSISFFDWHF